MTASLPRHGWMDLLRGFAALLVVSLHATLLPEQPAAALVAFNQLLAGFRMPLLMILSGMLLPRALTKPASTYLVGKVAGILYPLLLWTLIYGAAMEPQKLGDKMLWLGGSYLWFLLFLFTYFLAALAFRRVPAVLIAAVAAVISYLSPDGTKYFERYFFMMAAFFLGKFLTENPRVLRALTSDRALLVTLPSVVVVAIGVGIDEDLKFSVLFGVVLVPAIMALIWLARRYRGAGRGALEFVGWHSIIFYATHYPTCFAVIGGCIAMGIHSAALQSGIAFAVGIAACAGIALLTERYRPFDWLYRIPKRQQAWLDGWLLPGPRR